jgi:hypothetical protein
LADLEWVRENPVMAEQGNWNDEQYVREHHMLDALCFGQRRGQGLRPGFGWESELTGLPQKERAPEGALGGRRF